MSTDRLEAMRQFAAQQPGNPFPRYALAMELRSAGRTEDAADALRSLTADLPTYVPAWLQLGMLLDQLALVDEARTVLTQGIEQARAAGNAHALGEMQGVLAGLD
jgi:cytochrome c-type biogenesis protein CcmH/NrfG